jgi:hypothetical protein
MLRERELAEGVATDPSSRRVHALAIYMPDGVASNRLPHT